MLGKKGTPSHAHYTGTQTKTHLQGHRKEAGIITGNIKQTKLV